MDGTELSSGALKAKTESYDIEGLPKMPFTFHLSAWVILLLAVLLAYSNALRLASRMRDADEPTPKYFSLDNKFIILEDPRLRVPSRSIGADGISTPLPGSDVQRTLNNNLNLIWKQDYWWPKAVSGLYRPTTTTTYLLNYSFLGNTANKPPESQSAVPYLVFNLMLHFLNSVLVFYVVALLVQRSWPAFFAALVWAVHPICVETVVNIVGRADQLACFFALTGFLVYFLMGRVKQTWARLLLLAMCGSLLLIGMSAKENTVVLVFMALLLDFLFRPTRKSTVSMADWVLTGGWALFLILWLFWIVLKWDPSPDLSFFDHFNPEANAKSLHAAFGYAANLGWQVIGLAWLAGLGVTLFRLLKFVSCKGSEQSGDDEEATNKHPLWMVVIYVLFFFGWLEFLVARLPQRLRGRAAATIYVLLTLPLIPLTIWPLLAKRYRQQRDENEPPYWKYFLGRMPSYLLLATTVLFWFSIRARLFAGMREPELPFVDNPLVFFWEDGLGGHSVLSFITNTIQSFSGPVTIHLHDGRDVQWSWGLALGQMIPAWLTAFKAMAGNLMLMTFPTSMSCDYSYNHIPLVNFNAEGWKQLIYGQPLPEGVDIARWDGLRLVEPVNMAWANAQSFLALGLVLGLLAVAVVAYFRFRPVCYFILFVFLAMLPTTNLLFVMGSIQAERFLYIASLGFSLLITMSIYGVLRKLVSGWKNNPRLQRIMLISVARTLLVLLCVVFGFPAIPYIFGGGVTARRTPAWESDVSLWESAVTVCPNSFKTHKSLAYAWYERTIKDPQGLKALMVEKERWGQKKMEVDWILDQAQKAIWVTRESQIVFVHLGAYLRIKGDAIFQNEPPMLLRATPEDEARRSQEEDKRFAEARSYYELSANILEGAKPLDFAFNRRHHKYETSRGKTEPEIADIGNYEIYWNLGIAYMRMATVDQRRLAKLAKLPDTQKEQEQLTQQIRQLLTRAVSMEALAYMRHLAPGNVDAHLNIGMAYWQLGVMGVPRALDEAAVDFFCMLLLDNSRQDALQTLDRIYSMADPGPDPQKQPMLRGPNGAPQPNINSPIVRTHLSEAYKRLYFLFLDIRERKFAETIKKVATDPGGLYKFDSAEFPDPPPLPTTDKQTNVPLQAGLFLMACGVFLGVLAAGWWSTERFLTSKESEVDENPQIGQSA